MQKEQIGVRQFSILVLMFTIGTAIMINPIIATTYAKQNGWIAYVLSLAVGLFIVWVYASIGEYFQGISLVESTQSTLGKWLGSVVILFVVVYTIILSSLILSNIGYFVSSRILIGTPLDAIDFMFIVLVVLGVRLGLETLARSAEILLPLFTLMFILFIIGILPQIEVNNILPVMENGFKPIWQSSSYMILFTFGELVLFLMLVPHLSNKKKIKGGFLSGTLLAGLVLIIIITLSILVIGAETTARSAYPTFNLAKKIDIARFVTRIEIVMAGIWIITIFFKLAICVYILTFSIKELFQLRDQKCLTLPLGLLVEPVSKILTPSQTIYISSIATWMGPVTMGIMVLPVIIWLISWLKRKLLPMKGEVRGQKE